MILQSCTSTIVLCKFVQDLFSVRYIIMYKKLEFNVRFGVRSRHRRRGRQMQYGTISIRWVFWWEGYTLLFRGEFGIALRVETASANSSDSGFGLMRLLACAVYVFGRRRENNVRQCVTYYVSQWSKHRGKSLICLMDGTLPKCAFTWGCPCIDLKNSMHFGGNMQRISRHCWYQ